MAFDGRYGGTVTVKARLSVATRVFWVAFDYFAFHDPAGI
jgi:hypothetical protein